MEKEEKKVILTKQQWEIVYSIYKKNSARAGGRRPALESMNIKPDDEKGLVYFAALDGYRMSIYEAKGSLEYEISVALPQIKVNDKIEISTPTHNILKLEADGITYLIKPHFDGDYLSYEQIKPHYEPEETVEVCFSINFMIDQLSLLKKAGVKNATIVIKTDQEDECGGKGTKSPIVFSGGDIKDIYSLLLPVRVFKQ